MKLPVLFALKKLKEEKIEVDNYEVSLKEMKENNETQSLIR